MKNFILNSAAAFLLFTGIQMCGCGCKVNAQCCFKPQTTASNQNVKQQPQSETKTVTLKITGMTCSGCANHISEAVKKTDGVLEQEVKYLGDVATVKYDPSKTNEDKIMATIVKVGYKAEVQKDEQQKNKESKKN